MDDAANKTANKTAMLGWASNWLYNGNKDWDKRLKQLETVVDTKCSIEDMKKKSEKKQS